MVRFKVIKGSHLLLGIAVTVLTFVILAIILNFALSTHSNSVSTQANLVESSSETKTEAETNSVFASFNMDSSMFEFDPASGQALSIEVLPLVHEEFNEDKPRILIYHTHTHEAYEQVSGNQYVAIEAWRTNDHDHSIVRVGKELAELLESRGFEVVHDTTDHEQDDLGTAYTRSLETLQNYNEPFDLYIDLHRDAYLEGMPSGKIEHNGQTLAQLMLLIGNGEGFEVKPYYEENLLFAEELTALINHSVPGLCKDVLVKDGRYNQNIGIFSILVEVGHNKNTLEEALNALPPLADSLCTLMIEEQNPKLKALQDAYRKTQS